MHHNIFTSENKHAPFTIPRILSIARPYRSKCTKLSKEKQKTKQDILKNILFVEQYVVVLKIAIVADTTNIVQAFNKNNLIS